MRTESKTFSIFPVALLVTVLLGESAAAQDWQELRLISPTVAQLQAEQQGRVQIYDGLHEDVVDRAMDSQFGRIGNMMFVGVRHTAPDDSEYADDDCD